MNPVLVFGTVCLSVSNLTDRCSHSLRLERASGVPEGLPAFQGVIKTLGHVSVSQGTLRVVNHCMRRDIDGVAWHGWLMMVLSCYYMRGIRIIIIIVNMVSRLSQVSNCLFVVRALEDLLVFTHSLDMSLHVR